jgi:hypothetical protein
MKLLLCNVSWMRDYKGNVAHDRPENGGTYVREHGFGHEAINFQPSGGRVYGFVQLRTETINVSRLDPAAIDKADDVLVAWRARSSRGVVIVGWYKNATVYRRIQDHIPGRFFRHGNEIVTPKWIISTKESDAFLVPPKCRTLRVPVSHKGFGSQTFISFLDSDNSEVATFRRELLKFIDNAECGRWPLSARGSKSPPDLGLKLMIETAAMEAAKYYYRCLGYDVADISRENRGYDLDAKCEGSRLFIEVKGTCSETDRASVGLTPNEYRESKNNRKRYRICIVTNALLSPEVGDFSWDAEGDVWRDENTGKCLDIKEAISANLTIR